MMFRIDNGSDTIYCLIQMELTIHDHIIEYLHAFEFLTCRGNTDRERIGGFRFPRFEVGAPNLLRSLL